MSLELNYEKRLSANTEVVWDALTNPQITPLYMYGCEVIFEKEVGSPIIWRGKEDQQIYVEGEILDIEEKKLLIYTSRDPSGKYGDTKENCLKVLYSLSEIDANNCIVRVSQGDFSEVKEGRKRYEDSKSKDGWNHVLKILEAIILDLEE